MRCLLLRRRWWISRLLYVVFPPSCLSHISTHPAPISRSLCYLQQPPINPYTAFPIPVPTLTCANGLGLQTGRKRNPRPTPLQTRHHTRTNLRARRIHLQALRPDLHHLPKPKVLPHAREPQLQHRTEHGGEDLQFQYHRECHDGCYGWVAGFYCAVLFSGREER